MFLRNIFNKSGFNGENIELTVKEEKNHLFYSEQKYAILIVGGGKHITQCNKKMTERHQKPDRFDTF